MHWTIILILISLIINGIIVYLLRNSHDSYDEEPIRFPLIIWLLIGLSTFIPVVNTVVSTCFITFTIIAYTGGDTEFNDDFWLTKEY